jgi:hypothetical protein
MEFRKYNRFQKSIKGEDVEKNHSDTSAAEEEC